MQRELFARRPSSLGRFDPILAGVLFVFAFLWALLLRLIASMFGF